MDAIFGLVALTASALAAVVILGVFGRQVLRYSQLIAIALIVYFIAVANLLAVAQLTSLAAANLVAGVLIVGLLTVTSAGERRAPDDQGRDDWGR